MLYVGLPTPTVLIAPQTSMHPADEEPTSIVGLRHRPEK